MGDLPTHFCSWTADGVTTSGLIPVHILDCNQQPCKEQADAARRGCCYPLEHIENMLNDTNQHMLVLLKRKAHWELILDAKRRDLDGGAGD
jgi:hypothetical protein